jgi:hypothetical protein
MSASPSPSRAAILTAGSAESGVTIASGAGCSPFTSVPASSRYAPGSCSGSYRPYARIRRLCLASSVRHALVAIRCSQVRTEDRPSKPPSALLHFCGCLTCTAGVAIPPTGKEPRNFGLHRVKQLAVIRRHAMPLGEAVQAAMNAGFPPAAPLLVLAAYAAVFGYVAKRFFPWE